MSSRHKHKESQSHKEEDHRKESESHEHDCCTGDEILCVSVPSPISVALLGRKLTLEAPRVKLTSEMSLTGRQTVHLLRVLIDFLKTIGTIVEHPEHREY